MSKEQVKAAYDYAATDAGELSFAEGDIITVTAKHPSGWWTGTLKNGTSGTFPSNFTEPYTAPAPSRPRPTPTKAAPAAPTGGGDAMSELAAKLARRSQMNAGGGGDAPAPSRASIAPTSKVSAAAPSSPARDPGPARAPVVSRMAATMAPTSSMNKPPPPSRGARPAIDTGADSSVANARASILSKGLFGAPAAGGPSARAVSPEPQAAAAPSKPVITPRKLAPPPPSPRNRSMDAKPTPSPGLSLTSPATSDRRPAGLKKPPAAPSPRGAISTPTPTPSVRPAPAAPTPAAPSAPAPSAEETCKARAVYEYTGAGQENELLFALGDEIEILQKDDSGWWEGLLNGTRGWFPAEFVEEIPAEPPGPTIAERLAEVGSAEQRLAAPKKAVRSGRRPPTRGKRAGAAIKNVRTETADPPADISRLEKSDPKSPGPSRATPGLGPAIVPLGGPTRSDVSAMRSGLRRTVAPGGLTPTSKAGPGAEEKPAPVDFRANLRSTVAPAASLGIKKGAPPPAAVVAEDAPAPASPRFEPPKRPTPAAPSPRKPLTKQRSQTTTEPPRMADLPPRHKTPTKTPPAAPVPEPAAPTPKPLKSTIPPARAPSPVASTATPVVAPVAPSLPPALGEYSAFCASVESLWEQAKTARVTGEASARPHLNKASASSFAFALCTVDGVLYQVGDTRTAFTLQEAAYPFVYAVALAELGASAVGGLVGESPATPEQPMTLDNHRAQNALCPAGALALCSALYAGQDSVDRAYELGERLAAFSQGTLGCSMADLLASKKYNHPTKALAYWMQTAVPLVGQVKETLELVYQAQASLVSVGQLAEMAATLAQGGRCPTTGAQVVSEQVVQQVTRAMSQCLRHSPAPKHPTWAGESGALFTVIPGVGGLAFYSPPLNRSGLSSRALRLCHDIIQQFAL